MNVIKLVRWGKSESRPERVVFHLSADLLTKAADGGYNLTLSPYDARLVGWELQDVANRDTRPGASAHIEVDPLVSGDVR